MPSKFSRLEIPDVILVEPLPFRDNRGVFMELYKYSDFAQAGIREYFLQDNYSRSAKNVLRGLHYQKHPKAQGKLIRCLRGSIFDVAIDVRNGSPTYSRWVGVELSENNNSCFTSLLGLDGAEQGLMIVEWPERAGPGAFPSALRLIMDFAKGGARRLTADVPPAWETRWPR